MCRYCEPSSTEEQMCKECKRRYNRLSLNKSKLVGLFSSADQARVVNKILDDLAEYKALQEAGCKIPPVVAATLEQYKDVKRPGLICGYCGQKVKAMHKNMRMCEDCYKLYNYFYALYNGPKRPLAVKTRQTYRDMLVEIECRRDAGLKIPGVAARALVEEQHLLRVLKEDAAKLKEVTEDDSAVETWTEREPEVNPSIKRKSESIP